MHACLPPRIIRVRSLFLGSSNISLEDLFSKPYEKMTNTEKIEMFLEGDFIFTGFAAVITTVDWMLNGTVGTAFGGRATGSFTQPVKCLLALLVGHLVTSLVLHSPIHFITRSVGCSVTQPLQRLVALYPVGATSGLVWPDVLCTDVRQSVQFLVTRLHANIDRLFGI